MKRSTRWVVVLAVILGRGLAAAAPQGSPGDPSERVGVSLEVGDVMKFGGVQVERTPAAHPGGTVQQGDRFVALGGHLLPRRIADFTSIWQALPAGPVAAVRVRDGRLDVVWFRKPSAIDLQRMHPRRREVVQRSPISVDWLGAVDMQIHGVRIGGVMPASRAALAGLESGDTLLAIDRDRAVMFGPSWAQQGFVAAGGRECEVLVLRGDRQLVAMVPSSRAHRELSRDRQLHSVAVANVTPFHLQIAVLQKHLGVHGLLSPWRNVAPGEVYRGTVCNPEDIAAAPCYAVYARTIDGDRSLIEWLYRGGVLPEGAEAVIQWPFDDASAEGREARWVSDLHQPIADEQDLPVDAYLVPFLDLAESADHHHAAALVMPEGLGFAELSERPRTAEDLAAALVRARLASEAIRRQHRVDGWLGRLGMVPFHIGLQLDGDDDATGPGVLVEATVPTMPRGEPNPIQPGDVLLSLRGRPVYGHRCVIGLLCEHGSDRVSGGADHGIAFVVRREGCPDLVQGVTTFWFVKDYFESVANVHTTPAGATLWAALDGVFLGFGDVVVGAIDSIATGRSPSEACWLRRQYEEAIRQWHSDAYAGGEFAALFTSLPRVLAQRAGGRLLARAAGSRLGRVGIEVAENVIWSIKDGSALRTSQQLRAELVLTIPLAALGALAPGAIGRRRR